MKLRTSDNLEDWTTNNYCKFKCNDKCNYENENIKLDIKCSKDNCPIHNPNILLKPINES